MTPTGIQLFQLLKPKLGERETEALINFVDVRAKENRQEIQESNLKTCATKEELWKVKEELKEEISNVKFILKEDIVNLRTELKGDIASLDVKISDFKSDIIRWVFAFFVTLMLAIIGLYFKH